MPNTTPATTLPDGAVQVILDGTIYLTQSDIWSSQIFAVGDRVVSLMPGTAREWGVIVGICRRDPEKFKPYDDLFTSNPDRTSLPSRRSTGRRDR